MDTKLTPKFLKEQVAELRGRVASLESMLHVQVEVTISLRKENGRTMAILKEVELVLNEFDDSSLLHPADKVRNLLKKLDHHENMKWGC